MKLNILLAAVISFVLSTGTALADLSSDDLLNEQHVAKLDKINFLPALLPVILDNKDVIELTDAQVDSLLTWREKNREDVIVLLNEIVSMRVAIKQAALSPEVSADSLMQMQNDVFALQRKVMAYKLSCRDLVINTFNINNWEGFYMVLAGEGVSVEMPDLYAAQQY